jgi:hypothetical protein
LPTIGGHQPGRFLLDDFLASLHGTRMVIALNGHGCTQQQDFRVIGMDEQCLCQGGGGSLQSSCGQLDLNMVRVRNYPIFPFVASWLVTCLHRQYWGNGNRPDGYGVFVWLAPPQDQLIAKTSLYEKNRPRLPGRFFMPSILFYKKCLLNGL